MFYRRVQPAKPGAIVAMRFFGIHEIDGPWYAVEHAVLDSRAHVADVAGVGARVEEPALR